MTQPPLRVYDYIPRAHPLNGACSEEGCAGVGHRVPNGPGHFLQDQNHLYVKDSLLLGGRPFHTRITKWYQEDPSHPACFREDVTRRIQDVHNAVLRAVHAASGLPEGQALDPTRIAIRLVDDQTTEILVNGNKVGEGGAVPLVAEDGNSIFGLEENTVHGAMKALRDYVLEPARFSGGGIVVPSPLTPLSGRSLPPQRPVREPSPQQTDPSPPSQEDLEATARFLLGEDPPAPSEAPRPPSPEVSPPAPAERSSPLLGYELTSLQKRMAAAMDRVELPRNWPKEWPQKVLFEDFMRGRHQQSRRAFLELVQNPESRERGPQAVLQLLRQWKDAADRIYDDVQITQDQYLRFLSETGQADGPDALAAYRRRHSFLEWFHILDFGGHDGTSLCNFILNLSH